VYSLRREERSVSTKFCGTALKRHRDARVNQKQSFEFAGRDAALDRQSSNIASFSIKIAFDPFSATRSAASLPPDPEPITATSYFSLIGFSLFESILNVRLI
jgi:hypothetical protein